MQVTARESSKEDSACRIKGRLTEHGAAFMPRVDCAIAPVGARPRLPEGECLAHVYQRVQNN
jgi:hypothetical protein